MNDALHYLEFELPIMLEGFRLIIVPDNEMPKNSNWSVSEFEVEIAQSVYDSAHTGDFSALNVLDTIVTAHRELIGRRLN